MPFGNLEAAVVVFVFGSGVTRSWERETGGPIDQLAPWQAIDPAARLLRLTTPDPLAEQGLRACTSMYRYSTVRAVQACSLVF